MPTVSKEINLVKSEVDANNNKFWRGILYDDDSLEIFYGRVGTKGLTRTYASGGDRHLKKKIHEKTKPFNGRKGGYKEINIVSSSSGTPVKSKTVVTNNLDKVAADQINTNSPEARDLVKYLVKSNVHNIVSNTTMTYNDATGLFSTPLGIVAQTNIDDARDILINLGDFVVAKDFDNKKAKILIADYLMLIPQKVPQKLSLEGVIPDDTALKKQNDVLDSLQASLTSMLTTPPKSSKKKDQVAAPKVFAAKIELVTSPKIIQHIVDMYEKTMSGSHMCSHLMVKRAFAISIDPLVESFDKQGKKKGNIQQLSHGTRVSNVLSIIKSGLTIPPKNSPHCTGRMFGNGVYFSDQSTKALNYAYGYWGGGTDDNCFMFLADVAMGKHWTPDGTMYTAHEYASKNGFDSCFAKGGKSGVANNEMIVYSTCQVNLVYLVEFAPGKKRRRW